MRRVAHAAHAAHAARGGRRGTTLVELLTVIVVMGILVAVVGPRFRVSPGTHVRGAAYQLAQDLEVVRTRALAARRRARLAFDLASHEYRGYLAAPGDSTFAHTPAESAALGAFRWRGLENGVRFGRGTAPRLPDDGDGDGDGAVTLADARVDFSSRGVTAPFGTRGTIYLTHRDEPGAVAAVTVNGSGAFRVRYFQGGAWR